MWTVAAERGAPCVLFRVKVWRVCVRERKGDGALGMGVPPDLAAALGILCVMKRSARCCVIGPVPVFSPPLLCIEAITLPFSPFRVRPTRQLYTHTKTHTKKK